MPNLSPAPVIAARSCRLIVCLILLMIAFLSPWACAGDAKTLALSDREKNWLKEHPVIRLAPDPEFQPIEFFDQNGNYMGIGADYARLIEQKTGLSFDIVQCKSWSEVIERMKRREVDVLNAVVRSPQRETFMLFPPPYLTIPSVIIVRKQVDRTMTLAMLEGMHVVMVEGYGYLDLIRNTYPGIAIEPVADLKTALRKVSFGMADAFVGDLATASFYIESEKITNLRLAGETEPPNVSGFAVRSDWPELSAILEKAVALITDDERQAIHNRWIFLAAEPGLSMREFRRVMIVSVAILLTVIIGFLVWNRTLKRAVYLKTQDLRREVIERRQAEEALAESKAHLSTLLKTIPDLVWLKDPHGVYLGCNTRFERFFGAREETIVGKTDYDFVDKELADFFRMNDLAAMEAGKPCINDETIVFADDGHSEDLETIKTPVYSSSGDLIGVLGIARDITFRKRSEKERLSLRDQLVQAQKMESVGRLAGGVAHDFNNMLSIIMGYGEMVMESMDPSDPNRLSMQELLSAARRSTDIVRQLLAYARKQTIEPTLLDLNGVIENTLNMLRRLIGEGISLNWKPGAGLWSVKMDPSQIDQLLANLITNARDSIADVGHVVIETSNVSLGADETPIHPESRPGDYAVIAVSDDGVGMDRQTLENIFEPFYTTKELGKGTGLGLSTIYGIVTQNGGFITVHSEPGRGSTFRIHLPRCLEDDAGADGTPVPIGLPTGDETVMIVEDEPAILNLGVSMLEDLGYTVLSALTTDEAMRLANEYTGDIHLLFTDVVMPKMNGRDLARLMRTVHPGLKCLYMSGYTADVIADHGVIEGGVHFIHKPFSKRALAVKIRETLAEP
ncbi:hypothetical protein JCM14469_41080 [Desulfatiferula olefinivorans]